MFIELVKRVIENKKLYLTLSEEFKKNLINWKLSCPEETAAIQDNEFNEKGLLINSITITESNKKFFDYKIEVECT